MSGNNFVSNLKAWVFFIAFSWFVLKGAYIAFYLFADSFFGRILSKGIYVISCVLGLASLVQLVPWAIGIFFQRTFPDLSRHPAKQNKSMIKEKQDILHVAPIIQRRSTIYRPFFRRSADPFHSLREFRRNILDMSSSFRERKQVECPICSTMYPKILGNYQGPTCGHSFCDSCMHSYITTKTSSYFDFIPCPMAGCDVVLTPDALRNAGYESLGDLVQEKAASFAKKPRPVCMTCFEILECGEDSYTTNRFDVLQCQSKTCLSRNKYFCRFCDEELSKKQVKRRFYDIVPHHCTKFDAPKFLQFQKSQGVDRVKFCPSCFAMIYKNGGCSHMTCGTCSTRFCWYCLGDIQHTQDGQVKECPYFAFQRQRSQYQVSRNAAFVVKTPYRLFVRNPLFVRNSTKPVIERLENTQL